jgi:hypothetical protein
MRSVLNLCIALGLAFVAIGCYSTPQAELDAAKAAVEAAKQAEAEVYAADTYRSATTALNEATEKDALQDLEGCISAANRAKELGDRAKSEADASKQQTRNEAQAIINRVAPGLADARASLTSAPRGKGADEDLDQLNADISQTEANLSDARSNLSGGKFKDALSQARNAEGKLSQIQGSVQTATQKIEAWKEQNKPWFDRL